MVTVKDTAAKVSTGKRNIKISNVAIVNGNLIDEEGDIVERIREVLPSYVESFDLKITIELPDELDELDEDNADKESYDNEEYEMSLDPDSDVPFV